MEVTMFLAAVWGPVMVAVGLGFFLSRNHYLKIYREIEREPFAMLMFGILAIVAGMMQVALHNVWDTLPEILISLLGWLLLLKGIAAVLMPKWVDQRGNWFAGRSELMNAAGGVMLAIGAYLSWLAYFA